MDHGSIEEEQGRSRGERGTKQQERERTWELLTGRTGEDQGGRGKQPKRSEETELHHATNLIDLALACLHPAMHLLGHAFRSSARPGLAYSAPLCGSFLSFFLHLFLTWFLGVQFCDFWVQGGRKSGSRASSLDNKS